MEDFSELVHELANKLTMMDGVIKMCVLKKTSLSEQDFDKIIKWNKESLELLAKLKNSKIK